MGSHLVTWPWASLYSALQNKDKSNFHTVPTKIFKVTVQHTHNLYPVRTEMCWGFFKIKSRLTLEKQEAGHMLIPGISDKEPICTKTPVCYFVPTVNTPVFRLHRWLLPPVRHTSQLQVKAGVFYRQAVAIISHPLLRLRLITSPRQDARTAKTGYCYIWLN